MTELVGEAWVEIHLRDDDLARETKEAAIKAAKKADVIVRAKLDPRLLNQSVQTAMSDVEDDFAAGGRRAGRSFGEEFTRGADGRLRDARGRFVAEGKAAGEGFGRGAADGIKDSSGRTNKAAGDSGEEAGNFFSRAFRRAAERDIGAALVRIAGLAVGGLAAAFSGLPVVIGGTTAAVVALAAALVNASGAALALGGVLAALGLAAGTLKIGMSGVSDALKAQAKANKELAEEGKISESTQQALAAAMKNLAPAAAATVVAIEAQRAAWSRLRRSVQENLFTGIATSITQLSNRYLPILQRQLGKTATTVNTTARQFASFFATDEQAGRFNRILDGLNNILTRMLPVITPLVDGFLTLFEGTLPFATTLADKILQIGTNFSSWAKGITASGRFSAFLERAFSAARSLFSIIGNLGGILGSVFSAGSDEGQGLLDIINNTLTRFREFLSSADGQQGLASFFGLISAAGGVLLDVVETLGPLFRGLGEIFTQLSGPIRALGAALRPVIGQLSNSLGEALTALAPQFAALVTGLTPLVTAIGSGLVTVIDALLQALLPLVPALVPLITTLATGLAPIVGIVATVLVTLLENVGAMAKLWAVFVIAMLPVTEAFTRLFVAIAQGALVFLPLINNFASVVEQHLPAMQSALEKIVPKVVAFVNVITNLVIAFNIVRAKIIDFVFGALGDLERFVVGITSAVTRGRDAVINAFRNLPSIVGQLFSSLVAIVLAKLNQLASAAGAKAKVVVDKIIAPFRALASKLGIEFDKLPALADNAGQNIVNAFAGIPGRILDMFRGLGSRIAGVIGSINLPNPLKGLPGFAKGGIATGPSLAGEGRYAELVVPISPNAPLNPGVAEALQAVAAARGGGTSTGGAINVTQNIYLPTGDPQANALAVLDRFTAELGD